MAKVIGIERMTADQLTYELQRGGRFVIFPYVISVLIMSFRRGSDIYYIPPGGGTWKHGWPFALLTLLLGWWGFPWGLIWTPVALVQHLQGGRDVTREVASSLLT